MGHPQQPTPMEVENETAIGFLKGTMKQKHSKAIDMIFYWVKDRVKKNQFLIYWRYGINNVGYYVTKHHSAEHHQLMQQKFFACLMLTNFPPSHRKKCLHKVVSCLQSGCVNPTRNAFRISSITGI